MKSYLSVSQSTDKGNETDVKKQPLTQHGGRTSEHFLAILGESFARPCLCCSSLWSNIVADSSRATCMLYVISVCVGSQSSRTW